ncbi:TetR/AcrR family transcriptional regulator [Escherichia coli]
MKRERVVLREGAVGLSIDAVAKEAGVSKATVMYDHKSKQDLLSDLISRLMPVEEERVQQAIAESNNTHIPHSMGELFQPVMLSVILREQ